MLEYQPLRPTLYRYHRSCPNLSCNIVTWFGHTIYDFYKNGIMLWLETASNTYGEPCRAGVPFVTCLHLCIYMGAPGSVRRASLERQRVRQFNFVRSKTLGPPRSEGLTLIFRLRQTSGWGRIRRSLLSFVRARVLRGFTNLIRIRS